MLRRAAVVSVKVVLGYLCGSLALILYGMWPHYRLAEMLGVLAEKPLLVLAAPPLMLIVPSMDETECFIGCLLAFLIGFGSSLLGMFRGLVRTSD